MWIETDKGAASSGFISVTSHAEVWIETQIRSNSRSSFIRSPPTRRCGLKHRSIRMVYLHTLVTSHAEVWIETIEVTNEYLSDIVTSHAEVWIETII